MPARLDIAAEQLRRGISHGADGGDAFFFLLADRAGDPEIDQHRPGGVAVDHYV
jgi:hypothetical protein